ncbi:hypothetical protein LMG31884_09040 [Xanthomonas hydrangeae]|nr:hypothetical protein LMG31884_09040 [Xanthomonas hydrangeae]CAD7714019.1 hypothetical protein LMG31884_09040 [Xanthomonas hydrangeae]CAD7722095.1 hypothetical protein LMG31887_09040 [Xanthomonas hydrangeae]CAD7722099.1 hypothetical protein LMG31887_09040 [Xanthomonas hydrangeae]
MGNGEWGMGNRNGDGSRPEGNRPSGQKLFRLGNPAAAIPLLRFPIPDSPFPPQRQVHDSFAGLGCSQRATAVLVVHR